MPAISFDIDWREVKTAYSVQRFQILNLFFIYGSALYGLPRMLISRI